MVKQTTYIPEYYRLRLQICKTYLAQKFKIFPQDTSKILLACLEPLSEDSFLDMYATKKQVLDFLRSGSEEFVGGYKLLRVLGRGGQGIICLVEKGGKTYAFKLLTRMDEANITVLSSLKDVCEEAYVCIEDVYIGKPWGYYVMTYLDAKELHLVRPSIVLLLDIAEKVKMLHDRGIAHRDLKQENILARGDKAHIIDFDLATFSKKTKELLGTPADASPEKIPLILNQSKMRINQAVDDIKDIQKLTKNNIFSFMEAPFYQAIFQKEICSSKYSPKTLLENVKRKAYDKVLNLLSEREEAEVWKIVKGAGKKYRLPKIDGVDWMKNDVWTVGLIYYVMLTGENLFYAKKWADMIGVLEKWEKGDRLKRLEKIKDVRLRRLVLDMLDPDPKRRLDMTEVVKELRKMKKEEK